jgi:DNA-binding CsgD family transcriptional regulator
MRRSGVAAAVVWIQCAIAMADVAEGTPEAARSRIEAVRPAIDAAPAHDNLARAARISAVALHAMDEVDGARDEAQRWHALGQSGRNEHVEAMSCHLLGRVALARGELVEAEGHLHDALSISARRDFRLQILSCLESLGEVAALTESPAEAGRLLAAVAASREQLGAVRWPPEPDHWASVEERVRTALGDDAFAAADAEGRALSLEEAVEYASRARGKRRRPARGWDSLTPTELEVVRHAAAGLTNPQIGERMFISRATVKAHLSHIFAKLGASSRAELAAEAAKRGLEAN